MEELSNELMQYFQYGSQTSWGTKAVIIVGILLFSYLITKSCRRIIIPITHKLTKRTKVTWDDYLLNEKMLTAFCRIIPPVIWYVFLPMVFMDIPILLMWLQHICLIYLVVTSLLLIKAFLDSLYELSNEHEQFKNRPLKGIYQMIFLLAIGIGIVVIISILIDKDPTSILTGLGASAAILMLIFKDTILGLVAGVQLSANDMLRPGDWITIPKSGVDGNVLEVSLTTIKIQNFDKTIITLPPYALVSEAFQNWRGMKEAGGRRIKRSLCIDVNTVHFCSEEEIKRYQEKGWLETSETIETCVTNRKSSQGRNTTAYQPIVNLEVFRKYLQNYLRNHPQVKGDLSILVRELQPGAEGMPFEIYCFTDTVDWITYENIQCDIFAHILAIVPEFGLRVYQRFTGSDYITSSHSN